ncbi:type III secretion system HrpP C-terminal domain-containing protein [Pseudomonas sp. Bout1]|uniref:type III secretion system HrpP C-terminal domain-containing protein n=1 Tax=Pseudomonas sp. Bout1 TaxID=3048600 RepID=UPI002AB43779|nr:type III secretion system HrpP C-terminal domain-containing protein [Pseudomonas sp. Bout1]MDY7530911.1 type III secretion system HrpP C-terminal domain-containing protein [Pseudomonas sp. Bout1]MEB0188012.1 type III secretion system HrpP C-terminal domain-containing protein [Pseudomonas sp. Bout1]
MTQVPANTPERPRLREPRDEREPGTGTFVPLEQALLFTQLFSRDREGGGYGSSRTAMAAVTETQMIEAMAEQLAPRIQLATQWPLQAMLYLPRLGRITASVRREQGAWNVELEAQEVHTARWLPGVRQRLEGGLAEALATPVHVHLVDVDRA